MEEEAFSQWYNDIIERAEIMDVRYPVKGLYVWFPYGFKVRNNVIEIIKGLLDDTGHQEALFPLLIPEQEFAKEAIHIKGFEDEVYWVTHGGREPLNVQLALRPTSETAIYPMFSVWIRAHTDMPLKVYQVVNTFRYETKHTRPLIRLREITTFKEAHTAHASYEDAERQIREAMDIYSRFFDALCIPYTVSRRPDWDKFPGADYTMAFDTIFPTGRTLQIGTVHNLGQTFARTFDITFENLDGEQEYAYQTCYGISDRVIASLIAVHGDEKGLVIPPRVAPIQAVIVPIWMKDKKEMVDSEVEKLKEELSGVRLHVDNRDVRPGEKYYHWERRGVPLRIELGPRDIEKGKVVLVRRDTGEKVAVPREGIKESVKRTLDKITEDMARKAKERFDSHIHTASTADEVYEVYKEKGGVIKTLWCGEESCGKEMEDIAGIDILGIVDEEAEGACAGCGGTAKNTILLSRTY
jgi:prolyl-tRNA synthetase